MKYFLSILFLCFINHSRLFSQYKSQGFKLIETEDEISESEKEKKFRSLLRLHYNNESFDTLFNDTYMLMRWYYKNGQLDKAIYLNKRNLFLMDSIIYDNENFYRKNFYSLGFCYDKKNKKKEALKYYSKVLEYGTEDIFAVFSSLNIGEILLEKYDYHLAAEYFENTIKLSKNIEKIDYVTDASLKAAECYGKINTNNSVTKTIKILNEAISLEKKYYDEKTTYLKGYYTGLSFLYRHLGSIYADKNELEFEKAIYNLRESLKYAKKLKDSTRLSLLADTYHDIGNLFGHNNHPNTLKYFDTALTYKPDKFAKYYLFDNKGTFYKRVRKFDSAKYNIHKALKILLPNINEDYKSSIPKDLLLKSNDKFSTIISLIHKAEIFLDESRNSNSNVNLNNIALEVLDNADYLLDAVRLETSQFQTKLFWRNLASQVYTNAVKACYALNDSERAFYYMEKNKAIILLEDVLLEGQKNKADIPNKINKKYNQLKNEIVKYTNANDPLLNDKLLAKANFNNFIDTLDNKYKLYFKSIKPADIISLRDVQKTLKNKKNIFVEYIIGEHEGYGLIITQNETNLFEIEKIDTLKRQISQLKTLLKSPIQNRKDKERYNILSFSVYSNLFPKNIQALIKDKSLTIIPDNILLEIPFEALQVSEEDNDYLIHRHQISYANSLTFLYKNRAFERQNQNNAIGFAPIEFNNDYPRLNNSKKEIEQLKMFDEANLYLEKKAVKNQFKNNLEGNKIIHLSTHAGLDNYNEPFLVLRDSALNLNELYLTKNSAELVVLSACETGNGKLYNGEGVMSLSRGFFNTGAKSVASTLWSIDDKATSEIMESFYKNLKSGQSKSLALHNAKLNYLEDHSLSEASPYYWASFILLGDAGRINLQEDYTLYYVFGILSVIVLLMLYFKKNKIFGNKTQIY